MHRGRPETKLNIKSNLRRDNNNGDASGKTVHFSTQKTDTMLAEELRTILITQAREIEELSRLLDAFVQCDKFSS